MRAGGEGVGHVGLRGCSEEGRIRAARGDGAGVRRPIMPETATFLQ